MPLLKPVDEKLASLSLVVWTGALLKSIQSHTIKTSPGHQRWEKLSGVERPNPEIPASAVGSKSFGDLNSNELGLDVDLCYEQHT